MTVSVDQEASFSCLGGINRDKVSSYDDSQESSIEYQWYLDGIALTDGTVQRQTAATRITRTFGVGDHTLILPDDAQDVEIRVVGGAGGSGGNDSGSSGGGGEYSPQVGFGWTNGVALALLMRNTSFVVPSQRMLFLPVEL